MTRKRRGSDDSKAGKADPTEDAGSQRSGHDPAALASAWIKQIEAEATQLRDECEALAADNQSLRAQLTELTSYVDGRKRHWDELQAELAQYRKARGSSGSPGDPDPSIESLQAQLAHERETVATLTETNRQLETENQAQSELIDRLESDLEASRHRISVMELRPEQRLSLVGQDLQRMERKRGSGQAEVPKARPDRDDAAGRHRTPTPIDIGSAFSDFSEGITDLGLDFGDLTGEPAVQQPRSKRRRMLPLHDPDGIEYEITAAHVTIGRSQTCDIRILDSSVSRKHARLFESDDCLIIEDYASTNGILVNEQRVHRAVLHHGDIVSLGGRYDLRYVEELLESQP